MPREKKDLGLPLRPFLYTLDQIATLIELTDASLRRHVHYNRVSVGSRHPDKMLAHSIANEGEKPDWRVTERELIRWLRRKGFRLYERGWASS